MTKQPACAGEDPQYWFPVVGQDSDGFEILDYECEDAEEGRAICMACPIRNLCREKNWNEPFGIFGESDPLSRGYDENGIRVKNVRYFVG